MKLSVLTLLAAISEGKKKLLKDRYGATDEQLAVIDDVDPTPSGQYAEWLTRSWLRQNLLHLPEDRTVVRAYLSKFNRVKNKPEWAAQHHSKDILSFTPETIQAALLTVEDKDETPTSNLPTLSDNAIVVYQDATYILWKINNPKDAMIISAPAGWCTKGENMAERYCSEGSLYPAYKNGEPFFQYHPGGPQTGAPQFMNKFNSTMQSVKLMNEEAYNLIKKGLEASKDHNLATVVDTFSVPNLSEAETLSYLMDVLKTNPEYAKGNKEFQELESKFVGQRYRIFDLEELSGLMRRYPRTGEVVSKMLDESPAIKGLIAKVEAFEDYSAFTVAAQRNGAITQEEANIIAGIPALFSKVFKLFSKSTNFDAKVAELKAAIKEKDTSKAYQLSKEAGSLVQSGFKNNAYGYTKGSWANEGAYKAAMKYSDIVTNMVRPMMGVIFNDLDATTDIELSELSTKLDAAVTEMNASSPYDNKLREWTAKRSKEVMLPRLLKGVEHINSFIDTLTLKELDEHFAGLNIHGTFDEIEAKKTELILNKIALLFGGISESGLDQMYSVVTRIHDQVARLSYSHSRNSYISLVADLAQDLLTEPIKAELATITKLKAVTEAIEDMPLYSYSWLERLGEQRKAEIRTANEERLQGRADKVERGEAKARYSPKAEITTWFVNVPRNRDLNAPVPEPLSDRGLTFLMTSSSYTDHDRFRYFIARKQENKELEAKLLSPNGPLGMFDAFTYLDVVRQNERWPELETRCLNMGFSSEWVTKYKEAVFKDGEWPGFEQSFLDSVLPTSPNLVSYLANFNENNRNGAKWPELETRVLAWVKSEKGKEVLSQGYGVDRYLIDPLLRYVAQTKKRLSTELEEVMCAREDFAMQYLWKLMPPSKITEILNKFQDEATAKGGKTSSNHNLFAVMMKELENL